MAFSIFAMPASSVILLLSAAFGVSNGLPWPGPTPTNVYRADEWSPRPTSSPGNPLALFRRDGDTQYVDNTVCGWIGGKSDNPAVCRTGSACIIEISHGAPGYVGCCTTSGPCTAGVYTSCVDKNSPGGQSGPLVENNGVFTWYAIYTFGDWMQLTYFSLVLAIKNATKIPIMVDISSMAVENRTRLLRSRCRLRGNHQIYCCK